MQLQVKIFFYPTNQNRKKNKWKTAWDKERDQNFFNSKMKKYWQIISANLLLIFKLLSFAEKFRKTIRRHVNS